MLNEDVTDSTDKVDVERFWLVFEGSDFVERRHFDNGMIYNRHNFWV
jgi:hypothetical protein